MPTLEISKDFPCSIEKLYAAWTEPEQLKRWWKPLGKQLTEVENKVAEGGTVKYTFENNSLTIEGEYKQVNDHNLLEYTWNWHSSLEPVHDASYKLTVRFVGDENSSSIFVTQDGFENEENIHPHKHGWEQGLEDLKTYLANQEPNSVAGAENQRPPITGYNETPEQAKVGGG